MSKSVKISHYNKLITHSSLVNSISQELCLSPQTVAKVLETYHSRIQDQLIQGNAVQVRNFATYHLRRRDYDETRRNNFRIGGGAGSLPEFCYYPYAEMSTTLKKRISANKHQIALNINE